MIDPELDHRRIVSGDAAALTGAADTLADVGHDLDDARGRIHDAATTTDWSGPRLPAHRWRGRQRVPRRQP